MRSKNYQDYLRTIALPENAKYVMCANDAEQANIIPPNLIVRQAYQESRYRPDIIDGTVKSPAGAIGIMQIIPHWHPGVNALNAFDSIRYAAHWMTHLHYRFGKWKWALGAYNFGPEYIAAFLAADNKPPLPGETIRYMHDVLLDCGLSFDS